MQFDAIKWTVNRVILAVSSNYKISWFTREKHQLAVIYNVKACLDYMILSGRLCRVWFCHVWFFCLHWHYEIVWFPFLLYTWEKKMEEDNIVIALCIIIIASAILRIRWDRRRPRVWAQSWIRRHALYGAHHSLIKELSSEDKIQESFFHVGYIYNR